MAKNTNKTEPVSAMNYPEHEITYERFLGLTKWSVISMVTLLILMAIFLV